MIPLNKLKRINFWTIQLLTNILIFPDGRDVSAVREQLLSVLNEQIQMSREDYERGCDWMMLHTTKLWEWRSVEDQKALEENDDSELKAAASQVFGSSNALLEDIIEFYEQNARIWIVYAQACVKELNMLQGVRNFC